MVAFTLLTSKDTFRVINRRRTAVFHDIQNGLLTSPIKYGPRSNMWPSYEIEQIARARVAGWSDNQIRDLVKQLHEQRKDFVPASTYVAPAKESPATGSFEPAFAGA